MIISLFRNRSFVFLMCVYLDRIETWLLALELHNSILIVTNVKNVVASTVTYAVLNYVIPAKKNTVWTQ